MNNAEMMTTEDKAFVAGLAKKARGKNGARADGRSRAKPPKPAAVKKAKAGKEAKGTQGHGNSKKATILALLRQEPGATITEIATATGWQNHTIRAFLSREVGKKLGLKLQPERNDAKERVYRIVE